MKKFFCLVVLLGLSQAAFSQEQAGKDRPDYCPGFVQTPSACKAERKDTQFYRDCCVPFEVAEPVKIVCQQDGKDKETVICDGRAYKLVKAKKAKKEDGKRMLDTARRQLPAAKDETHSQTTPSRQRDQGK